MNHEGCKSKFLLEDKKRIDAKTILKSIRQEHTNKLVFAHININSLRNKFELLVDQVKGNIDVLMISETKIDDSFPLRNFLVGAFSKPYRLDRDSLGGGILLYVREDIQTNLTEVETKPIEGFYVEINLRSDKWLINYSYNPYKNMLGNHLRALSEKLDIYSTSYDNFISLGDFNIEMEEQQIKDFCDNYSLKSLIRQPTCHKSPSNPTCIDLILTNALQKFQSTCVLVTGLSDFHLMTVTVMSKVFKRLKPRTISYRSYKHFSNEAYRESLIHELSKEVFVNNDDVLQRFCDININILNRPALRNRKLARGNQMPFITKDLSKAIMKRSRLRNNFLKNKTEQNKTLYTKQRNYCVSLLKKSKKKYFANLNEKDILDNKLFWKTIKPSFSDKIMTRDRINLSEKGELVKTELETAEVLNKFFSNIVSHPEISKYSKYESFIENIEEQF